MTRTYTTQRQRAATRVSALDRARTVRKKKPYKILLEAVTQEKKKLRSVMTYRPDPPTGYMYVPLGNRDITEFCKEKCRERNREAHIVSAKPKKAPSETPSDQEKARIDTQRIGHHFPSEIVDEACENLGYDRFNRKTGKFFRSEEDFEHTQLARSLHSHGQRMQLDGRQATESQTKEQIRSGIMEVFPKIPRADLDSIVTHAFEEGTKRVGNAADLPLARRVQLAVGAYIRHQYTDYDAILKSGGSWLEARAKAQPASIAKMKEWRDENENNETEETWREIIVLDDDDDDESTTSDDTLADGVERGRSLEIVSSRVTGRELQPEYHSGYTHGGARGWKLVPERDYPPMRRPAGPLYADKPRDSTFRGGLRELTRVPQPTAHIPATRSFDHDRHYNDYRQLHREPLTAVPSPRHVLGEDGMYYDLTRTPESRPRSQLVEYIPVSSSSHRQHRDAHVQAAPRVSRDDYRPARTVPLPLPLSRRNSGDQDVVQSIEDDSRPLHSPRRVVEPQHRRQQAERPTQLHSYPATPTNVGSPINSALPSPAGAVREDHLHRPRLYEEVEAPPPSMFARMHSRRSGDFHTQARVSRDAYVDSSTFGLRPSGAGSVVYATPAHPYVSAIQHDRSYVSQPLHDYPNRDPGYHPGASRYDLRCSEEVVGPRDRYR